MKLYFGVKGLISREDGKILIVREAFEYVDGTEVGKWDVVGGRIEAEEPIFEGFAREIMEECSLKVNIGRLLAVTESFIKIKGEPCHIIRAYYTCSTVLPEEVRLSTDHDSFKWITPESYKDYNLMEDLFSIFEDYCKSL